MSILEAWAYELPVVMTDYCNLPEGFSADAAIHIDTEVDEHVRRHDQDDRVLGR